MLLSLIFPFLGLLYLQRPRLAWVYLVASVLAQASAIGLFVLMGVAPTVGAFIGNSCVSIVAAIHAFRIAGAATPTTARPWYSRWHGLIVAQACVSGIALLIRSFLFEPFNLPSESMYPTLTEGSFVIVKKWGYGDYGSLGMRILRTEPAVAVVRGELLLFRRPDDPDTVFLKRVIGLPGDHIQCSREGLVINGTPVPALPADSREAYQVARETLDGVSYTVAYLPARPARDCQAVVPEGHYFMMGDNRDNSRDSRYIGPIPRGNLVGRVLFAIRAPEPD